MKSLEQKIRERMSSDHKYPCVWCGNDVVAVDMPRVTACSPCYLEMKKENPERAAKLQTWGELLSD